jgi:hypothetical protein
VRKLFAKFENRHKKNEIQQIADNNAFLYAQRVRKIEAILRNFIDGHIVFVDIAADVLKDMASVSSCDSPDDESPTCIIKENGDPQLAIPKRHLISGYDNEQIYVGRLADELVRNERVKEFMYNTKTRLNAENVDYQIRDDEFILVQSALTTEYFSGLTDQFEMENTGEKYPVQTNRELANPSISVAYPNAKIPVSEQYKDSVKTDVANVCLQKIMKVQGNQKVIWGKIFPEDAIEVMYFDTPNCSFEPIILFVREMVGMDVTVSEIKHQLWEAYRDLFKTPGNFSAVMGILKKQGKAKLLSGEMTVDGFHAVIFADTYNMSDLDYYVLADKHGYPFVIFNANGLKGFGEKITWIKMGNHSSNIKHLFIRSRFGSSNNGYNIIKPYMELDKMPRFMEEISAAKQGRLPNLFTLEEMLHSMSGMR